MDYGQQIRADAQACLAILTGQWPAAGAMATRFLACFHHLPPYAGYKYMPAAARQCVQEAEQNFGAAGRCAFLYRCLLQGMLETLAGVPFSRLPARVQGHQLRQYRRILDQSATITEACDIDQDVFHKELGLVLLRLYAAAAQLVDFRVGVGRSLLFKGGWKDIGRRLQVFIRTGGFKPFFAVHNHKLYLDEFNEEGRNEVFRCCADLYQLHPEVLGMCGGSWFYDPALSGISPRLNYLRDVPLQGGAYLMYESTSAEAGDGALATSPTRRKLHAEGKYVPKNYVLIWPKAAQLSWVRSALSPQLSS